MRSYSGVKPYWRISEEERHDILAALTAAQDYADAYRDWHVNHNHSKEAMIRFRTTRDAQFAAFPEDKE